MEAFVAKKILTGVYNEKLDRKYDTVIMLTFQNKHIVIVTYANNFFFHEHEPSPHIKGIRVFDESKKRWLLINEATFIGIHNCTGCALDGLVQIGVPGDDPRNINYLEKEKRGYFFSMKKNSRENAKLKRYFVIK